MWYKINYDRLAILMLPTFLRKPLLVGFVQALLQPIASLHYKWLLKRTEDWYILEHTGQVCKLRKVLNDRLDNTLRRIEIKEGNSFPRKYIYTRAENKPVYLGKFIINSQNDYENTGVDFVVSVPADIAIAEKYQLEYLLDFYKLAGKRYKIEPRG